MILDIRPDAPPTFDNFLTGANAEAVIALRDFIASPGIETMFLLWGEAGTGKSHLLSAAATTCRETGHSSLYLSPGERLPESLRGWLFVDDVEQLDDLAQIDLFNLINQAREGAGHIVAASVAAPAALELRTDLRSRLSWGLTYRLAPLSDGEKLEALSSRALARGMDFSAELGRHMLSHCRRDLPHLLALVDGLDEYSMSLKRPPTLPLLREYLKARN